MATRKNRTASQTHPLPPQAPQDMMTMDEAIAMLKTTRPTFYRWVREGKLKGFKVGRQWRFAPAEIQRFLTGQEPQVDLPVSMNPLIEALEAQMGRLGAPLPKDRGDEPVNYALQLIVALVVAQRASDIHINPHFDGTAWQLMLRYRIDGVLHVTATADIRLLPALAERWKKCANMNVMEKRLPQDGRITFPINGETMDIRTSCIPSYMGECITARALRPDAIDFSLDKLGLSPTDLERLQHAIASRNGLVVAAGPTGTGKTTVLYSCLKALAGPETKTMTIEDPIEYIIPWTVQMGLNESGGATFPRMLRACLRADPNAILVGEVRDNDTLQIALQAALTGNLVLTTLHARDAVSALRRMVDIGAPAFLVGDATLLVTSHRLVRRLCPHCSKPAEPTSEERALMADLAARGGVDYDALPQTFRKSVGCPKCAHTGFAGRMLIAESLAVTPAIAKALRENISEEELRRLAVSEGMTTMEADGVRKAALGQTTLREIRRVCS